MAFGHEAVKELYPPQTETTQRLASALERVAADALEGSIQRAGNQRGAGRSAALRVVTCKHREHTHGW